MDETIYAIELLHQGKYDSWEFSTEVKRDQFYEKVKQTFSGREIEDKETADDFQIVQLSATSLNTGAAHGEKQPVPFEWFEREAFEEMLGFINEQYPKQK